MFQDREDHPARAWASWMHLRRIQFTPDLLPSDVNGLIGLIKENRNLVKPDRDEPVVLANEINRATTTHQSAY